MGKSSMDSFFISKAVTTAAIGATLFFSGCSNSSTDPVAPNNPAPPVAAAQICESTGAKKIIRSDYVPGEITKNCDSAISQLQAKLDAIGSIQKPQQTVDNTLLAFEAAMADFSDATSALTFMAYVSTNPELSAEGSACEEKVGQYYVTVFTRRDLYQSLSGQVAVTAAQQRLLSETIKSFEANGLKLSDEELAKVKELKSTLATKESQFSTNLNNDTSTVIFTAEELAGAPASFLERLEKTADGKYIVTTKSTDYTAVAQNVSVSETRRKMAFAYLNRGGPANTKLLEEAIVLRAQIAKILGHANWADYRTSQRMAKSSAKVLEFLNGLKGKLAIRNQKDMDQLLAFKKETVPEATSLDQWDIPYYTYQLQKRDFALDNEKIRQYFPASKVTSGIFDIYSKLLGVQYVEVQGADVWAEGVKLYEIHEGSDCTLIGYFYADLVPRPGKYGHAAAFPLVSGRDLSNGYSLPVASIVANFTPPSGDKPSLLTHSEVETFFHEFGHIMHQTLTRASYASIAGTSVAQDFVEAPSQMLENWVWSPQILKMISGHYQNPEQTLPEDILQKMLAARNFQQGAAYTKQLLYALFDMTLHTQNEVIDVTETYNSLYRQIIGQEPLPGNHFPASFGHLMGGYDAGYYGYLWSEVYAQDMFSIFPANNLTDSSVGMRYRKTILEKGNSKDAMDLIRDFLMREPSDKAFLEGLGIGK
ncbi:MAG: M3 family metallopeptidase [Bdellovibrionota bacterium]